MSFKYTLSPMQKQHKALLLNIKEYFSSATQSIHKARNELKIIPHADTDTVIKSFKVPHLLNQFIYSFFRDSKAKRSYNYSLKIGKFTPEPIGYVEFYSSFLLKNSYYVSKKFNYTYTIREPLSDKNFKNRNDIFKAFARFSLELHQANIYHNDYSPGNILIQENKGKFIFKIVDINRMKFLELNQELRARNFSKLWADDDVLRTIATEYIKHYLCDNSFIEQVLKYSKEDKEIKNFKNRLKWKKKQLL